LLNQTPMPFATSDPGCSPPFGHSSELWFPFHSNSSATLETLSFRLNLLVIKYRHDWHWHTRFPASSHQWRTDSNNHCFSSNSDTPWFPVVIQNTWRRIESWWSSQCLQRSSDWLRLESAQFAQKQENTNKSFIIHSIFPITKRKRCVKWSKMQFSLGIM
jgi:hypothetical protein